MRMKRRKKRGKAIAWLILTLSLCAMAIAGIQLFEVWNTYQEGNEGYEQLIKRVRPGGLPMGSERYEQPTGGERPDGLAGSESCGRPIYGDTPDMPPMGNEPYEQWTAGDHPVERPAFQASGASGGHARVKMIDVPDMSIDFTVLQTVNHDAVAWLYCPGTAVDYPVVRATDYDYYLHHLPDGTANANGSLFIDYNWVDFTDQLLIVYGHNMKSGRMFGSLTNYKKQAYFVAHPYLYLYSAEGENYRVDLLYGCVIGAGQWRERAFMFKENIDSLLAYAAYNTTFKSHAQYEKGDKIIALSTCSYEFNDARYIVIGVLRPEYGDD